jgi:hypothetical protein
MPVSRQSTVVVVAALACTFAGLDGARLLAEPRRSDEVVKAAAQAAPPGTEGKQVVTVTLTTDKHWYIWANPSGDALIMPLPTVVTVEGKKADDVRVDYPEGNPLTDPDIGNRFIWTGTIKIKVTVQRGKDDPPLTLKVRVQAERDAGPSVLPSTIRLSVP